MDKLTLKSLIMVFLGGGLGSVFRYAIGRWIGTGFSQYFPFGTLTANVIACFILGLLVGLADQRQILSATSRLFWAAGFCGGFSTFSTFSLETLSMFQTGHALGSISYMAVSLLLCIGATLLGVWLGHSI